jgi:hypothetical protein
VVKKYKRVNDIIHYQTLIVKRSKAAFNQFKDAGSFTVKEIEYIGKVYSNLFQENLRNIDELSMIITAGQLRMSDDERLQSIDRLFARVEDQFSFLESFNSGTSQLALQRKAEQSEINLSKKVYGY